MTDVNWAGVIRRWSRDYEFRRSNHVATYLEPRSLGTVVTKLSKAQLRYAATGALAALRFAPVAPARTAARYIDDIAQAATRLDL